MCDNIYFVDIFYQHRPVFSTKKGLKVQNVFINNFVHISLNNQKSLGKKKKKTFYRQMIGDLIFMIENIICVIFGCLTDVDPINNPLMMTYFVSTIFLWISQIAIVYFTFLFNFTFHFQLV